MWKIGVCTAYKQNSIRNSVLKHFKMKIFRKDIRKRARSK